MADFNWEKLERGETKSPYIPIGIDNYDKKHAMFSSEDDEL